MRAVPLFVGSYLAVWMLVGVRCMRCTGRTGLPPPAAKARQPTLCLLSALARHELTDVIPPVHDVAIPRGAWQPVVSAPVQWHKFAPATFEVGRATIQLDDRHAIGLYDAPRTIIDAFRLRHAVGPDIANEALRRWLRSGGKPADLMRLTKVFPGARPALLHALQVLV